MFVFEHFDGVKGQHHTVSSQGHQLFQKCLLQGRGPLSGQVHVAHAASPVQVFEGLPGALKARAAQHLDHPADQPLGRMDVHVVEVDDFAGDAAGKEPPVLFPGLAPFENGFDECCLADAAFALKIKQVRPAPPDAPLGILQQFLAAHQWDPARCKKIGKHHS